MTNLSPALVQTTDVSTPGEGQAPMDPLGILSARFSIGRALFHGWRLFYRVLPTALPVLLLAAAIAHTLNERLIPHISDFLESRVPARHAHWILKTSFSLGEMLLVECFNLWSLGTVLSLMVRKAEGESGGLRAALHEGMTAWPRLLVAHLLFGGATVAALFSAGMGFMLPVGKVTWSLTTATLAALSSATAMFFAREAAFREPGQAFWKTSSSLANSHRWRTFALLALLVVGTALLVTHLLDACVRLSVWLGAESDEFYASWMWQALMHAVGLVVTVLCASIRLAAYYALKRARGQPLPPR